MTPVSAPTLLACALLAAFPAYATTELNELSLEQLMEVPIIGASKYAQKQSEVAAAVSVITRDEIKTYGWHTVNEALASLPGTTVAGCAIALADDFAYTDPVDGSVSQKQGIRVILTDGSRVVFRLSGTGTEGATLRVYLERHEPDASRHDLEAQSALKPLIDLAETLAHIRSLTGMEQPTVMT